jgi:hypothetical protein
MASPHPFHERPGPVSDTAGRIFSRVRSRASARGRSSRVLLAYAFRPLAVSFDSMVKMAS